jgi:hypothetical protein
MSLTRSERQIRNGMALIAILGGSHKWSAIKVSERGYEKGAKMSLLAEVIINLI